MSTTSRSCGCRSSSRTSGRGGAAASWCRATAALASQMSFTKQFDWGTLSVGGNRRQEVGSGLVSQTIPTVSLAPSPINITPSITWSPGFSFNNQQAFHQVQAPVLLPGGALDTLFADNRATTLSFQTPLRVGPSH